MHLFFICLHFLGTLHIFAVKTHASIFYVSVLFNFLCYFYLPYINLIPNEKVAQIRRLSFIMKNDVRHVATRMFIERLTELQRSCQQMVTSFSSLFCELTSRFFN